jgi:serine/threonine protein kinase
VGQFPDYVIGVMDIYEGRYLAEQKVAIKMMRSVLASPKSLERFEREVKIWANVWNIDKGQRILPFYGFCQTDGPYPYVVSPWQRNGNAFDYVKANDYTVNYRELVNYILFFFAFYLLTDLDPRNCGRNSCPSYDESGPDNPRRYQRRKCHDR